MWLDWLVFCDGGFQSVEKAIAAHSNTLAWTIPRMEEAGRLQSMGSRRVGHLLSDFTFTFHFHALEKEMAAHSSVLAWRIPGMAEPGGLPSVGSHRVRHDWSNLAAAAAALWWRRIRGLWKLPDGRTDWGGKLGLILMGGAMLSKSLCLNNGVNSQWVNSASTDLLGK